MIVAGARRKTHATGFGTGVTMLAGETEKLVWKRLNQLIEPGFGIPQYGLAVADEEDVEVQIQELAQAVSKAGRVIHYALRQESALPRRVADDCIADDQDPAVPPDSRSHEWNARALLSGADQ